MIGGAKNGAPPPQAAAPAPARGLGSLLKHGLVLSPQREAHLKEGLDKGLAFYDRYNESRLELALGSFDEEMRHALYEIIYLMHVNDPSLANWSFKAKKWEQTPAGRKAIEYDDTADLYVEGAPHGVQGFGALSAQFRSDFQAYTNSVFKGRRGGESPTGHRPIVSLHCIGSIGTVGHKSGTSDLDLQVVYSLEPFTYEATEGTDDQLRDALKREASALMREICQKKNITPAQMKDPRVLKLVQSAAASERARRYPNLHKYLIAKKGDYIADFRQNRGAELRIQCLHEIINLMKRYSKLLRGGELEAMEKRLKERIQRIQDYVAKKFPGAEVYLFPMSIDDYRQGRYSSTIEFKESSGSAYELILNHDTLMAGIQFTPVVPTHFIFPADANNNFSVFWRLNDYIRFEAIQLYDGIRDRLVNLGSAPDLNEEYVAKHVGAAYWEAFKASSGNLPKATLNLLRYEMLLHKRYLKTIVQLIKEPKFLDALATPKPEVAQGIDPAESKNGFEGLPAWSILEIEEQFPKLHEDPWWLRYKVLKIAFTEPNGVPELEAEERSRISKMLDLAFALHVRVSDVFTKPGDRRTFEEHREQVLVEFLARAFAKDSEQRQRVDRIFIGDVQAVNEFEEEMRDLFKRSLERVRKTVAKFNVTIDPKKNEEFQVWHHYYRENFEPKPNIVQRSILNHLKVARGRLQIGFKPGEGWFFKSLQKESGIGKRFDTFGMLDHLPDNVTLVEKTNFMGGLAHCIINGYYGVVNKGTLKERKTALEFDGAYMKLGHSVHDTLGFIRPDQVDRILDKVLANFPYRYYNYLDCIRLERRMTEVFIFLNLWQFGRLSFLARDNLQTFYCDEYDHDDVVTKAETLRHDLAKLVQVRSIQSSLGSFFDTRKVLLKNVNLTVWVNPNSFETAHSPSQTVQKEEDLSAQFEEIIRSFHG